MPAPRVGPRRTLQTPSKAVSLEYQGKGRKVRSALLGRSLPARGGKSVIFGRTDRLVNSISSFVAARTVSGDDRASLGGATQRMLRHPGRAHRRVADSR